MAASTIPNSGGPGSSIELSPVTIAVRDKVIEKFADQPLDAMNESVKQLLSREEDEQKRLGILAARVYILRQRISRIAEGDLDRVVSSAAPKASDLVTVADDSAGADTGSSEWKRLRILDDCEVNGVRFPKTVIIDVKIGDADKLIASGSAELVEEDPESSAAKTDTAAAEAAPSDALDPVSEEADASADMAEADETANDAAKDTADDGDDLSALSAALEDAPATQMKAEELPQQADEALDTADQDATGEAVIDTPSAAEVTAALEALSTGDTGDDAKNNNTAAPVEAEAETKAETAVAEDNADDAADVAAELEALSATLAPEGEAAPEAEEAVGEAAAVAAELEAAAAAMAAGPSNPDTTDLPPAGGEEDAGSDDDNADKPAGWFEAQQNAEAAKRDEDKSDDENA